MNFKSMSNERIAILADPKGKAWKFAKEVHENLIHRKKRQRIYNLEEIEVKKFNDGDIFGKPIESVRGEEVYLIHDSSMPSQDWFASLLFLNDAIGGSASASKLINVLPYMRYSRQDRVSEPRSPISASVLAKGIKEFADGVITTDLHNPALTGLYREKHFSFENLRAYIILTSHLIKDCPEILQNSRLLAPDAGATQITNSYNKRLNIGMVGAYKLRENPGEVDKNQMEIQGNVKGKNIIITDDMIDTAGTLCTCAELCMDRGAKAVYAVATHGIFSYNIKKKKHARQLIEESPLEKVIVTDSIPQKSKGKVEVVSLTNLIADSIYRVSHNLSISELYK
jgi:ribose-phosphate pyrophosphokinase